MLIRPESTLKVSENFKAIDRNGPGCYSPQKPFGSDAKSIRIEGPWK